MNRAALADFLRIHIETLYQWGVKGRLSHDIQEGQRHYYAHKTVNTFLRERIIGKGQQKFTVARLLAYEQQTGQPGLLTVAEVAGQLEVVPSTVWYHIMQGSLPAFTLADETGDDDNKRHMLRVPAPGLATFIAGANPDNAVRSFTAAKILGIDHQMVMRLAHTGRLEEVKIKRRLRESFVSRDSLLALVTELLDGGDAEMWIAMREAYGYEPLLTKRIAARQYHSSHRRLTRALTDGELPYIKTLGDQVRIPLHAMQGWRMSQKELPMEAVAALFGRSVEDVTAWSREGKWCKVRHGGRRVTLCPRLPCITGYITEHRGGGNFTGEDWLTWCEQDKIKIVGCRAVAHDSSNELDLEDLQIAHAEGTLRSVLLPNGDIVARAADIVSLNRRLRLKERKLFGGYDARLA